MLDVIFYGEDNRFTICQKKLRKYKIDSLIVKQKKELDEIINPKIIVLPFQGIKELTSFDKYLFEKYKNSLFIFYNKTEKMDEIIKNNKLNILDLNKINEFSFANNIASSEPTLKYIIEYLPYNFSSLRVCLLGYGKYGKEIYKLYNKLGMNVDVYVRKEEVKKEIGKNGYLLNELENNINKYTLIVNTIPFNVINDNVLHKISLDTLMLDVSSFPYGWNHETAKYLGLNSLILKGIPGIYRHKEIGEELAIVIRKCLEK